jgi:orotidine-5'-phosphate decarboxylase
MPAMNFADRLAEASRAKDSVVVLGIDPQLDVPGAPGIPPGYTLTRFCCEIVEACARSAIAVKPQLAFYEARGLEGMQAFCEVVKLARRLGLITIADAKRGDIGTTSAAYAEAFLGDGDFNCDAVTVNPYQGSDALMPFIARYGRRLRRASTDGAAISSARAGSARSARWLAQPIPCRHGARVS